MKLKKANNRFLPRTLFSLTLSMPLLLASPIASSHSPLFDCFDNGDDTITCEGGFTDGSSAAGINIRMVDGQGKILAQGKLDDSASINFDRPATEFSVVFSGGDGHEITVFGDDIY